MLWRSIFNVLLLICCRMCFLFLLFSAKCSAVQMSGSDERLQGVSGGRWATQGFLWGGRCATPWRVWGQVGDSWSFSNPTIAAPNDTVSCRSGSYSFLSHVASQTRSLSGVSTTTLYPQSLFEEMIPRGLLRSSIPGSTVPHSHLMSSQRQNAIRMSRTSI